MSNSCLKRIIYDFLHYATKKVPEKYDGHFNNLATNLFHLKPEIILDMTK